MMAIESSYPNPYLRLKEWLQEARDNGLSEEAATAMLLSTVIPSSVPGQQARPRSRIVLLKKLDERGLVFFTNFNSDKAQELAQCSAAALCFFWPSLGKQIRLEVDVVRLSEAESAEYFAQRPRMSQIGAWASKQSQVCTQQELEARVQEMTERFAGVSTIPKPPFWGAYLCQPLQIEFWHERPYRLHQRDRYVFFPNTAWTQQWRAEQLFP